MKTEFVMALTQVAAERNLPREVVIQDLEKALETAFRKEEDFAPYQNLSVKVNPVTGEVRVLVDKIVVKEVTNPTKEISLAEANKIKPGVQEGEVVEVEVVPKNAGRIAAQTAKQVLIQRLRKTEQVTVLEEFESKAGDIISGVIQKIEPRQIWVDLGRAQGILPISEQVRSERYRVGQRLRFYVLEVQSTPNKGVQIILSRTHKNLLRRLFELEIPEVYNGRVEVKALAREPGSRSKVAVAAREAGIDPVGSCVGLRGIRIQNIVKELNGEKLDVIAWDPDPAKFIANALSPAQVLKVQINPDEKAATVIVPDKQLSLAIGKEGQNARLAAKLTGWRIDIKSVSMVEVEKAVAPPAEERKEVEEITAAAAEETAPEPAAEAPVEAEVREEVAAPSAAVQPEEVAAPPAQEAAPVETKPEEAAPTPEGPKTIEELLVSMPVSVEKPTLRFAEDIFAARRQEKKKERKVKEEAKPRKARRIKGLSEEEEDLEDYF